MRKHREGALRVLLLASFCLSVFGAPLQTQATSTLDSRDDYEVGLRNVDNPAEGKNGWDYDKIPNPSTPAGANLCNRNGTKHSAICDPNFYITSESADKIDMHIRFIRKNVTVIGTQDQKGHDLQIGVCIIDMIKPPFASATELIDAYDFGKKLYNHWGLGDPGAGNGILLLLAIEDRRAAIITGSSAQKLLSDHQGTKIIAEMGDPLRAGNIAGAVEVALDRILRAAHGLYPDTWSAVEIFAVIPACIAFLYVSCIGFCIFWFACCSPCLLFLCRKRLTWQYQSKYRKAKEDLRRIEDEQGRRKEAKMRGVDAGVDKWQCPICLGDFSFTKAEVARFRQFASMEQGLEYHETEPLRGAELYKESGMVLRCGHRFCKQCMEGWTSTTSATTPTASCPVCRTPIPQGFVGDDDDRVQRQDLQFRLIMFRNRHSEVVNDDLYRDWNSRVWSNRWDDRFCYSHGLERSFDLESMIATNATFSYLESMGIENMPSSGGGGASGGGGGGGGSDWGGGSCDGGGGASGGW